MAGGTLKVGTITNSAGTGSIVFGVGVGHTMQVFTSSSGTYTTPTNCRAIWVRCVGAGGGGGGSGTASQTSGTDGGTTTFGVLSALGGKGGNHSTAGGTGATSQMATGGDFNCYGGTGQSMPNNSSPALYQGYGGAGGNSIYGGGSPGGANGAGVTGSAGKAYGGGGGGVGGNSTVFGSCGGGGGSYCESFLNAPSATYSYAIGSGGAGGAVGTGGGTGGVGYGGCIIVMEFYV